MGAHKPHANPSGAACRPPVGQPYLKPITAACPFSFGSACFEKMNPVEILMSEFELHELDKQERKYTWLWIVMR